MDSSGHKAFWEQKIGADMSQRGVGRTRWESTWKTERVNFTILYTQIYGKITKADRFGRAGRAGFVISYLVARCKHCHLGAGEASAAHRMHAVMKWR